MAELILWKDQEMRKLRSDMDRLFSRCLSELTSNAFWAELPLLPPVEVTETADHVIVRTHLPDMAPEDLDVRITGDRLLIRGKREAPHATVAEGPYSASAARRFRSFSRTVQLPARVMTEEIQATFQGGVLHIVLPKRKNHSAEGVAIQIR